LTVRQRGASHLYKNQPTAVGRRINRRGEVLMPRGVLPCEETLRRVRAEFLEMPGLKLTVPQAQRLWGVDRSTCEALIEELTEARFLSKTRDGAVVLRAATV